MLRGNVRSFAVCLMLILSSFTVNFVLLQTPSDIEPMIEEDDEEKTNEIIPAESRGTRTLSGWSDEMRLTQSSGDTTEPDMAVSGSNAHVVWSDGRNGHLEIYYKRSLDNGLSWSGDIRLTTTSHNQFEPKIAVSSNNIHLVWYDDYSGNGASYYMNSTDNGDTWGSITSWDWTSYPPCSPSGDVIKFPDITMDGNNIYIVAFAYMSCDIIFKRSTDNGDSWSNWIYVDGNLGGWYGYNSIDTDGNLIHILWELDAFSADYLYHLYSYDQGDNWISDSYNPVVIAEGVYNGEYLINFASSMVGDNFQIAYNIYNFMSMCPVGTFSKYWDPYMLNWHGPVTINSNGMGHVDVVGNHVVCCIEDLNNNLQLYSNKYGQITDYTSDSIKPTIGSSGDVIHLVWVDNRHGNNELYYAQRGILSDLTLTSSNIQFNPASPVLKGTGVTIKATIHSKSKSSSNVEVKFYNGNPDTNGNLIPDPTANEIGNDIININKDSSSLASIQWTPPAVGSYNVYVWADPNNNIQEYKINNNIANKVLDVILIDLALSNSSVQFKPSNPVINCTTISIEATVFSYRKSISNVEIKFYIGNPDTNNDLIQDFAAQEIGKDIININKDSSTRASIQWLPPSIGTYNIYVWADPNNKIEEDNYRNNLANSTLEVLPGMFSQELYQGWNLISIPLEMSSNNMISVFQTIEGQYDSVRWYNTTDTNDPWKSYHLSKPPNMNDLDTINQYKGIWLHITEPNGAAFTVIDNRIASTQSIPLRHGWNLVGYPSTANRLRNNALNNLVFGDDVESIWTYAAGTQKWEEIGVSDNFELGRGYWIHASNNCEWIVFSPILNLDKNRYYLTIQDAIDDANPCDTIEIYPGIYNEEITISKPVTLLGRDNQTCIIKGINKPVVKITDDDVTISNLNLMGGQFGVHVTNSKNVHILNNIIPDFRLIGVYALNSSVEISNNRISEDPMRTGGAGIRLTECKESIVECNTIKDIVYNVYLMYSSAIIRNNIISPTDGFDDRLDSIGIALYFDSNATVIDNLINGGDVGIGIEYNSLPIVEGNTITDTEYYGIWIKNFGAPSLKENTISDCTFHGIFSNHGISVNITNNVLINNDIKLSNSTIDNLLLISGNATAINTSIENYQIEHGSLEVQWYLHVKVVNLTNVPVNDAYVEVKDNYNGSFNDVHITGLDGFVRFVVVTEFWQNEIEKICYTPHNITVSIGSSIGYAEPEPWMDTSQEIAIEVDYP